jgi:predicted AAA+ superfamily ATPase
MATYTRLLTPPDSSFFLFGLRGTGKTSWAKGHFGDAEWFNLLSESLYQELLLNPGLFADRIRRLPAGSWVVIDEAQRLPNLLNEVHRAIEELGLRFAILGSSARKVRTAGVNLLGGRAVSRYMYPLLPDELGDDFDLSCQLQFGSLPLILAANDRRDRLEGYVQAYLREEIQVEALVRNLPAFARFLPIAALFHGQALNVSGLARDAGVNRSTVEGYLGILEDTLLTYRLPAFEGKLRVKERSHPKLYWVDNGVMRATKRQFAPPVAEECGALFEGYIGLLLKAYRDLKIIHYDDLYYYAATSRSSEIDFLIRRGDSLVAIEVKYASNLTAVHLKSLRSANALKGLEKRFIVYNGTYDFVTEDGIIALSLPSFMKQLAAREI